MSDATFTLSPKACAEIEKWALQYPAEQRRSVVTSALKIAQAENGGHLTESVMNAVAAYLGLPNIAVYEVATFYDMFHLEPVGQHVIDVCTNISCMLAGCDKITDHLQKRLHLDAKGRSKDGRCTVRHVECLAACAGAPMMQIGKQYYEHLTPESVDAILDDLE